MIDPENTDVILVPELEFGMPNSDALFVYSDSAGNLFKMTRQQYLAFIATNAGVARTTLDTEFGNTLNINWQTDIDPAGDGTQTYAQRHGANVVPIIISATLADGIYTIYETQYYYTANGSGVQVLTIPDLFTGKLTII